ncbi:FAD-dependent oxidoreductase [Mycobacterium sp. CBMA271]|uniref:FAD-dependent oxidoreductase n=1 Tax=unclassified Mycobacteroides TaxID=2618759 RepID=UPI0012DE63D7|nr:MULTISPECIES: FAD-dependent oxidoreductase [unclassified Mycobacteroides]MUM16128.1 epoxide hydrolase [Mycobacteroides sp. CBMA 326]MUM22370.1 FAD-dependent oxidoreductase [Mycobacteroides sp. CBMA 271]
MTPEVQERRDHAVVLGAGIAGLVAARVLSETYESVTVVERDDAPRGATPRNGVPQGQHFHSFMSSGSQTLERLFPGILDELVDGGATVCDEGDLSHIRLRIGPREMLNRWEKFSDPETFKLYLATRPFLEFHIRQRVQSIGNVRFLDGHDVVEPMTEEHRVTGVRAARRSTGLVTTLISDLVVDATGRKPRTLTFLDRLGYERPSEIRVTAPVTYASQLLRVHADVDADADKLAFINSAPGYPYGGGIARCENNTIMMTLGAFDMEEPPTSFTEMVLFAEQFVPSGMLGTVRSAIPISDVHTFRYREAVWRRYDQMPQFPEGLLVIGDAICSLDPIKGQGMTMAIFEAITLRDCLMEGDADLARRYFGAVATRVNSVWQQNKMTAPQHSDPPADAPVAQRVGWRLLAWWTGKVLDAARDDIRVTETILRVNQLHDSPSQMQRPGFLWRVATHRWRRPHTPSKTPCRQLAVSEA